MPPRAALAENLGTVLLKEGMRFLQPSPGFVNSSFPGSAPLLATSWIAHVAYCLLLPPSIFSLCYPLHFSLDKPVHWSSSTTIFIPNCRLSAFPRWLISLHCRAHFSLPHNIPPWAAQPKLRLDVLSWAKSLVLLTQLPPSTLPVRGATHIWHSSTDMLSKAPYMTNDMMNTRNVSKIT